MAPARLRLAGAARLDRHARKCRDIGRAFAHPQRFVDLPAGALAPFREQGRGQGLAGGEPMAQARELGRGEGAVFQHLAIERGHGREERGAGGLDELRPDLDIPGPDVEHGGGAIGPGIGQPDPQGVAPVEGAGMEHDIGRSHGRPALIHGPPAPGAALGMEHPLGLPAGAGGVDEKTGVLGGGVGIGGQRCGRLEGRDRRGVQYSNTPGARGRRRQPARQRHGGRAGIRQQEIRLGRCELRRDRQRHDAGGNGAEEEQGVVAGIGQADHQPLARRQPQSEQPAGDPARRQIEGAIAPLLRGLQRRLGIGDDEESGFLRRPRGRPAEAIACQVESGRRRLAGVAKGNLGGRHSIRL